MAANRTRGRGQRLESIGAMVHDAVQAQEPASEMTQGWSEDIRDHAPAQH
jgi:hypothetical protein